MSTILSLLMQPLVSGIIGYATTGLAIGSILHPRHALHIFGIHIPFTPGLVYRIKPELALSAGNAVKNTLDYAMVGQMPKSPVIADRISATVDSLVDSLQSCDKSIREYASSHLSPGRFDNLRESASTALSDMIYQSLTEANLGERIARMAIAHLMDNMHRGISGRLGASQFLNMLASPVERLLADNIDEMIRDRSQPMISKVIDDQVDKLLGTSVGETVQNNYGLIVKLKQQLISFYTEVISHQLPQLLSAINIPSIVSDMINRLTPEETYRLIHTAFCRQLQTIPWLGALIGLLIGCLNLLF